MTNCLVHKIRMGLRERGNTYELTWFKQVSKRGIYVETRDCPTIDGIHPQLLLKREHGRAMKWEHIIEEAWRLHCPSWPLSFEESKWQCTWTDELPFIKYKVVCFQSWLMAKWVGLRFWHFSPITFSGLINLVFMANKLDTYMWKFFSQSR